MKRGNSTSQGGFIGTYILIGIGLVLATGIVLYMINVRGETARREQAIAAADADSNATTDSNSADDRATGSTSDEDATDASTGASSGASTDSDGSTDVTTSGATETDELPQTGPADTMVMFVAIGAGTYMLSYYAQARRRQRITSLTSRGI